MLQSPAAGPQYPYDYNTHNSWDGSYQQSNVSAYYNAQKHAHCYPGTTTKGTNGWFMWNIRDHSGERCGRRLRVQHLRHMPRVSGNHC